MRWLREDEWYGENVNYVEKLLKHLIYSIMFHCGILYLFEIDTIENSTKATTSITNFVSQSFCIASKLLCCKADKEYILKTKILLNNFDHKL